MIPVSIYFYLFNVSQFQKRSILWYDLHIHQKRAFLLNPFMPIGKVCKKCSYLPFPMLHLILYFSVLLEEFIECSKRRVRWRQRNAIHSTSKSHREIQCKAFLLRKWGEIYRRGNGYAGNYLGKMEGWEKKDAVISILICRNGKVRHELLLYIV